VAFGALLFLALAAGAWGWVRHSQNANSSKSSTQDLASLFVVDAEREFPETVPLAGTLPGEFETHEVLLIGWPDRSLENPTPRQQQLITSLNHSLLEIISQAQATLRVIVVAPSSSIRQSVLLQLDEAGISRERVEVLTTEIDTRWVRDFGPYSLRTDRPNEVVWVVSRFFCEVGQRPRDERMAKHFSLQQKLTPLEAPLFLDGGNIQTDGQGLIITSTQTLDLNRLHGENRPAVSRKLREYLGARRIVYLEPLAEEVTGHVDMFLTMPSPNVVVLGQYAPGQDPINRQILDRNAQRLSEVPRKEGPLTIVRIPMPPRGANVFGGTYTNVVYANGILFVPKYADVDEAGHQEAVKIYQRLLPDWKIVSVESSGWLAMQGSIHCLTKNLYRFPPQGLRPRA
jgi:agmatine deiminase